MDPYCKQDRPCLRKAPQRLALAANEKRPAGIGDCDMGKGLLWGILRYPAQGRGGADKPVTTPENLTRFQTGHEVIDPACKLICITVDRGVERDE